MPLRTFAIAVSALIIAPACTSAPDTADADSDADADGYFPAGAPWYEDVSSAGVDPDSAAIIGGLQSHGWGSGDFQIDLSIEVLEADASTPRRAFETTGDFYDPDCDHIELPVPVGGNLEGEDAYACTGDGDCHLLVAERAEGRLYEMWRANLVGDTLYGGCLAVWDMTAVYPDAGRGEQCTSADAAGYPIAPLLFTADEVAAGAIDHAMRFAIPNDDIDDDVFYAPATHATTAGADGSVPYGAHLRLKSTFDLDRLSDPEARVVAVALQKYGMFLADGGNIPLMGRSDRRTTAKWDELFEDGTHALFGIEPQDFEVVAFETDPVGLTFDCVRNGL